MMKITTARGLQNMDVGRNIGVVGWINGFHVRKCVGLCSGHKKVVVIKEWSYGGLPLYLVSFSYFFIVNALRL